jgi:trans-2,3-dihydro-3-hydroxyanthranilate isomerase
MPSFRYVVADVFTDQPLEGNQLAVFTDASGLPERLMQPLAREIGFSETVFVLPPAGDGHARIRIFTPGTEVPFAGHPTLGTAFVLAAPMQLGSLSLETGSGVVPVELIRDASGRIVFGRMSQPIPTWEPVADERALLAALGVDRSELPVELYDNGLRHAYVALASKQAVAALEPDWAAFGRIVGLCANCFAGDGTSWKTRMFWADDGVGEDAATGSAAGPLAVHLARHGRIPFGEEIEIEQGAEIGRPSRLYARVEGTPDRIERVEVGGSAVVVARGEFRL